MVKDSDEDEKTEIATRRKRKENREPANAQELVHGDCLSTRPSDHPDPSSIQGHHHRVARQTPQVPGKTICSTRSLDSSRSLSAVGGLIKGDEHSRLGQSTKGSRVNSSLIGCESSETTTCFSSGKSCPNCRLTLCSKIAQHER